MKLPVSIRWQCLVLLGGVTALTASTVLAQAVPTGSGAANPAVAAQRTGIDQAKPLPVGTTTAAPAAPAKGRKALLVTPRDFIPDPAQFSAPPNAKDPVFVVTQIVVEGSTVINPVDLGDLLEPFEYSQIKLSELRTLARRIQGMYRHRGYFAARVFIPKQAIRKDGKLRLVVSEGKVGQLVVEGNKHYSTEFIERFFGPAMRSGLLREPSMQRALLALNEFADLRVSAVLRPSKVPGTADIVLTAADASPLHVLVDYNNFGNTSVGRNRAGLGVVAGNTVLEGDEIFAKAAFPFPSDSDPFYQLSYTAPVGDLGSRLGLSFSGARTRISGPLSVLDIRGQADVYGLNYTQPLEKSLARTSSFSFGLNAKTIKNFFLGTLLVSQDDLRTATLGYGLQRAVPNGRAAENYVVTQGLGTFANGRKNGDRLSSRLFAGNAFTKLNADLFRLRQFNPKDQVLLRGSAQVSADALVTAELFAIGGPDSVRGFIPSEFLGDDGISGSAEYRRLLINDPRLRLQAIAFFDAGHATIHKPSLGEIGHRTLIGAGTGLRASVGDDTSLRLDAGFPLSPEKNAENDSWVLYSQVATRF